MGVDMDQLLQFVQAQGMRLLGGLAVLAVGCFAVRWIVRFVERSQKFIRIEPTLKSFLHSLMRILLYVVVILTAASVMGVPLTSFITLLASAGVAVSLAMQGALSNFVGGMTMLLLKPFKAGDYVKIGDTEGTTRAVGVFYTELTTPDNRHISLPNSSLTNTAIVNYTREGTRRLDMTYAVSYASDMDRVFEVLTAVVHGSDMALPDPAPTVHLAECADSSLKFVVRLWCRTADYWTLYYYLMEEGKRALDRAGIEIPFPQLDVHVR